MYGATIENNEKTLAYSKWELAQAKKTSNPRVEEFKELFKETTEIMENSNECYNNSIQQLEEKLAEINEDIQDVVDGNYKVNSERQEKLAKEFLEGKVSQEFCGQEVETEEETS